VCGPGQSECFWGNPRPNPIGHRARPTMMRTFPHRPGNFYAYCQSQLTLIFTPIRFESAGLSACLNHRRSAAAKWRDDSASDKRIDGEVSEFSTTKRRNRQ